MTIPDKELKTEPADFLELSQELLDRGGLLRFQAHGNSMHPFIINGDVIVIEAKSGSSVSPGDIIYYRRQDGSPTAHRLIKTRAGKDSKIIITKGDSVKFSDPPIAATQVMGRVILIEGRGRNLMLDSWPGRISGRLIAWLGRRRFPNQRRVARYLGRLAWFCGGRPVK